MHRIWRYKPFVFNPGESVQGHEEYALVFDHPARELFWWAVLLNRQSLASFFWQLGQDQIGTLTWFNMIIIISPLF